MKTQILVAFAAAIAMQNVIAASATKDDVRFFEHFQRDAARSSETYVEGNGFYAKFDDHDRSISGLRLQGGIPFAANVEVGFGGGFIRIKPDNYSSESGLTDIDMVGKYHLSNQGSNRVTIGASLTLPIGDEDVGQGNADIGFFGAIRHPIDNKIVVMGSAGLNFEEQGDNDRETSVHLGGGAIYQVDRQLHLTGELGMDTEGDRMALTAGADYRAQGGGRLRGAVSLGLDDGSPDFALQVGYLVRFY